MRRAAVLSSESLDILSTSRSTLLIIPDPEQLGSRRMAFTRANLSSDGSSCKKSSRDATTDSPAPTLNRHTASGERGGLRRTCVRRTLSKDFQSLWVFIKRINVVSCCWEPLSKKGSGVGSFIPRGRTGINHVSSTESCTLTHQSLSAEAGGLNTQN